MKTDRVNIKALLTIGLVCIPCCTMADTETVYQTKGDSGEAVFSDQAPLNQTNVRKIKVTPANSIPSPTPVPKTPDRRQKGKDSFSEATKARNNDRAKNRRKQIREAEKALEAAKIIREGDMLPHQNGGVRYTDQYKNRIKKAENNLKKAKKPLNS